MEINTAHFEKLFFKAFISDPVIMSMSSVYFREDIFTNKSFGIVGKFYKIFFDKYKKLPTSEEVKLFTTNPTFEEALRNVVSVCKSVDYKSIDQDLFFEQIESYLKRRLAVLVFDEMIDKMSKTTIDPDTLVEKFEKISHVSLNVDMGFDVINDVERYISQSGEEKERIATGFSDIDKNISGGVPANGKCLGIVAAPTNMGKSIMLGNIAVNAMKNGKRVLIISLEMSEYVYADRVYAALYDLDINAINFMNDELREFTRIHTDECKMGSMTIKEFPPGTMTVEQIEGYLQQMKNKGHEFDLICLDYITLLNAPNSDNSNDAGRTLSRKLRALTYRYKAPVWTAAQINRAGMDDEVPALKYFAESIAITSEADLILSLYRQPEDIDLDIMRCRFLKSRFGPKDFSIQLYFNVSKLRFEDMNEDETIQSQEKLESTTEEVLSSLWEFTEEG